MTQDDIITLADTIYGEARGEYKTSDGGIASLIAVANVVMNRLKEPERYGFTIAQICRRSKQFSCWNSNDPNRLLLGQENRKEDPLWRLCYQVAEGVTTQRWPDLTKGSNHYYAKNIKAPYWANEANFKVEIGKHRFYRLT